MSDDYSRDLKIDPDDLDGGLLCQASLFMEWSEKLAEARTEVDTLKQKLAKARAMHAGLMRMFPERYPELGKNKPSETSIEIALPNVPEVGIVIEQIIEAMERMNVLSSAVASFDQRRSMLKYLSELWIGGYWGQPQVNARHQGGGLPEPDLRTSIDMARSRRTKE